MVRAQPRPARSGGDGDASARRAGRALGRPRPPGRRDLPHSVALRALVARAPLAAEASPPAPRRDASRPDPCRLPRRKHAGSGGSPSLLGEGSSSSGRPIACLNVSRATARGRGASCSACGRTGCRSRAAASPKTSGRRRVAALPAPRCRRIRPSIDSEYVLYTGGMDYRKNVGGLFRRTPGSPESSAIGTSSCSSAGSGSTTLAGRSRRRPSRSASRTGWFSPGLSRTRSSSASTRRRPCSCFPRSTRGSAYRSSRRWPAARRRSSAGTPPCRARRPGGGALRRRRSLVDPGRLSVER